MNRKKLVIFALIILNLVIGMFLVYKYFEYRDYLIAQKAKESLRAILVPILSPSAQKDSQDLDALRDRARAELLNK